jgi:hypothetical protein
MLRLLRSAGWACLGVAAALGALELLLRVLPTSTATLSGYYVHPQILTYPPGHEWKLSTGWDLRNPQRLRANNFGFVAERDFVPDPDAIAVIGDSFVEAAMLDAPQRAPEQLADALRRSRPVYGMGSPGSSLLDYAERICFAADRLQVRDFVVLLEASDIRQSLCGSGNVHGPCLDRQTLQRRIEPQPSPSLLKQVARHSALAQYVFGQLKVSPERLLSRAFARSVPAEPVDAKAEAAADSGYSASRAPPVEVATPAQVELVRAVAEAFVARAQPCVRGQLVLLVDGRRENQPPPVERPVVREVRAERRAFIDWMRARQLPQVAVVDADGIYHEFTSQSPLALVVGPYDAHLNRIGLNLLMRSAARELMARPADTVRQP